MRRVGETGQISVQWLLAVVLLVAGAAILIMSVAPVGDQLDFLGGAGLENVLTIASSGQVSGEEQQVSGDGELDILAIPFLYGPDAVRNDRYDIFLGRMQRIKTYIYNNTSLQERENPENHVSIDAVTLSEVDSNGGNPDLEYHSSGFELLGREFQYANATCNSIMNRAESIASSVRPGGDYDKIVVWMNGTSDEGGLEHLVFVDNRSVLGCTDRIGGMKTVVESSLMNVEEDLNATRVAMHELGHAFGLCHNNGVPTRHGACDMSRAPPRPSICENRNDVGADGPDVYMNYCKPLTKFSGHGASVEDEYEVLSEVFEQSGWAFTAP